MSTQAQVKYVPMPGTAASDTVQRIHEAALAERARKLGVAVSDLQY